MSSQNYFDLLGDDENEEPTAVIARATLPSALEKPAAKKLPTAVSVASPGRLSTKPPPSTEQVKELKPFEGSRGGRGGGRGVRGGGRSIFGDRERESGYQRESRDGLYRERIGYNNDRNFSISRESSNDGSQGNRGGVYGSSADGAISSGVAAYGGGYGGERTHRGDSENWSHEGSRGRGGRGAGRGRDRGAGSDVDDRLRRREFDRRSGSGFGNEIKRDGSGRGNWGSEGDQTSQQEAQDVSLKEDVEKVAIEGEEKVEAEINVEDDTLTGDGPPKKEADEEDNELTLDEYEKILESKRKALLSSKTEERKVQADKAFASMQLVDKKNDESVFIKLGSDKEKKKKEALEKEEKAKKTQSINEFLKPADGEKYYGSGGNRGRGRGRGREGRGGDARLDVERVPGSGGRVNFPGGAHNTRRASAPRIEDPGQFPNLGAK